MVFISILLLLADIIIASIYSGKLPTCVSQCHYINGMVHYFLLAGAALTMLIDMVSITPDEWQFLSFLSCAALVFVASAASYLDRSQKYVHSVAAIICAACAISWALIVVPYALSGCSLLIVSLLDKKRRLLWAELAAFTTAYIGVILLK